MIACYLSTNVRMFCHLSQARPQVMELNMDLTAQHEKLSTQAQGKEDK